MLSGGGGDGSSGVGGADDNNDGEGAWSAHATTAWTETHKYNTTGPVLLGEAPKGWGTTLKAKPSPTFVLETCRRSQATRERRTTHGCVVCE